MFAPVRALGLWADAYALLALGVDAAILHRGGGIVATWSDGSKGARRTWLTTLRGRKRP